MTIVLSREGIVPSGLPLTCSSTHRGSRAGAGNGGISAGARNGPSGSRYRRAVNSVAGAGSSLLGTVEIKLAKNDQLGQKTHF